MSQAIDYYDLLGISRDASELDVINAYKRVSYSEHPRVSNDPQAFFRFVRIHTAYVNLSNRHTRALYDKHIGSGGREQDFRTLDDAMKQIRKDAAKLAKRSPRRGLRHVAASGPLVLSVILATTLALTFAGGGHLIVLAALNVPATLLILLKTHGYGQLLLFMAYLAIGGVANVVYMLTASSLPNVGLVAVSAIAFAWGLWAAANELWDGELSKTLRAEVQRLKSNRS